MLIVLKSWREQHFGTHDTQLQPFSLDPTFAGTVAALGQALIPYYTGQIIDDATIDPDRAAFQWTTLKLVAVTAACALSTGVRGGLFTVAMTRLNVRIRTRLFAALLQQEIGFFDTTRTGKSCSLLLCPCPGSWVGFC